MRIGNMVMADDVSNRTERQPTKRRVPASVAIVGGSLLLLAAGCGAESSPSLGNDTLPTSIATTTTVATIPPETTTTIDFDRPPEQDKAELVPEASAVEVAAVVDDMRGPTRDVSEQMRRLATFMKLSSPTGAQIMDFATAVVPEEDDRNSISTQVLLRAPQPQSELVDFFDAELRARGWNKARSGSETEDGIATSTLVFRIPGTAGDETELAIAISDGPVTLIDIDFRFLTEEDDISFDQLAAWQDAVRLPRSAQPLQAEVATVEDTGMLTVTYSLIAETAAEARQDVTELVRSSEFEIDAASGSGENAAPVVLIDETGQRFLLEFAATRDPEIFEMMVSTSFDLRPID